VFSKWQPNLLHIALLLFAYDFKLQTCIIHHFYKLSDSITEALPVFWRELWCHRMWRHRQKCRLWVTLYTARRTRLWCPHSILIRYWSF